MRLLIETKFYNSFTSNNENTLGKGHWLVKGNIGVTLKDKTRNIPRIMTTGKSDTLVKNHWLEKYNFRATLKNQQ